MPRTPKGQKRPTDVISNAVHMMRIATGEITENDQPIGHNGKSAAAVELGRKGGLARAQKISATRRKAIARKAAEKRWKHKKKQAK